LSNTFYLKASISTYTAAFKHYQPTIKPHRTSHKTALPKKAEVPT
jgi:hypothetical protein